MGEEFNMQFGILAPLPGNEAKPFAIHALTATAQDVVDRPALLFNLKVTNAGTQDCYLQLFDKPASDVLVGTTAPVTSLKVPGSGEIDQFLGGISVGTIEEATGLSMAATTTPTGNSAAEVSVFGSYRERE